MEINWFPGHMAKATREIKNELAACDIALYVLDCRAVRSCFNPQFDALDIPLLYILNKADTVTPDVCAGWVKALAAQNKPAVAVDGANSGCRSALLSAVLRAAAPVLERQNKRGLNEHIRAMVIGVPNTGKSTIINTLCKKSSLDTGNRAGVTRAARWARVDNRLDVLDTPGTLYPKISDRTVGENLAIIGSIRDEVLDPEELAPALIKRLNNIDPTILPARYGREINDTDGLESIAAARGFRIRGGQLDLSRAAITVLDDFRKGRLGKIALERAV